MIHVFLLYSYAAVINKMILSEELASADQSFHPYGNADAINEKIIPNAFCAVIEKLWSNNKKSLPPS